jgi:hypothetical protein
LGPGEQTVDDVPPGAADPAHCATSFRAPEKRRRRRLLLTVRGFTAKRVTARQVNCHTEGHASPAQVRAVEGDATVVPVPSEHEHIRGDLPGEEALRDEAQPEIPAFAVAVVAPAPDPLVLEGLVDGEAVE